MKTTACILATLLASASAFAPTASSLSRSTGTSLNADFSQEVGAQAPLGFFDPVGLLDGATDAQFYRLREQEVRHGRVAMVRFQVSYCMFFLCEDSLFRKGREGGRQKERTVGEEFYLESANQVLNE